MTREQRKMRRRYAWIRIAFVLGLWVALAAVLVSGR